MSELKEVHVTLPDITCTHRKWIFATACDLCLNKIHVPQVKTIKIKETKAVRLFNIKSYWVKFELHRIKDPKVFATMQLRAICWPPRVSDRLRQISEFFFFLFFSPFNFLFYLFYLLQLCVLVLCTHHELQQLELVLECVFWSDSSCNYHQ